MEGPNGDQMSRLIGRATKLLVLLGVVLAFLAMGWVTRESDRISVARQGELARHAMESSVEDLAIQQETLAVWDDLAAQAVKDRPDREWLDWNAGGYLHQLFGHDEVYILDGHARPSYAFIDGKSEAPERYRQIGEDLATLVATLQGGKASHTGQHDHLPGKPVGPSIQNRPPRSFHDSHLMLIRGRPAAASVMQIRSATPGWAKPNGDWPLLVSIRYLDGDFLPALSKRQLIDSPRFSRSGLAKDNEQVIALTTEWGAPMGFLIFKPVLFGTQILTRLAPLLGLVLAILLLFSDLTGRKLKKSAAALEAAEAQAAHLAYHDPLTGLSNRTHFQRLMNEWIARHLVNGQRFAVAMFDADEFKLINDTLGHDAGDAVLIAYAERLRKAAGPDDVVARLGGDEFAIMLREVTDAKTLGGIAAQFLDLLGQPFEYRGHSISCRASIGATLMSPGDESADLLKHADLALYEAKASGRATFRMYDPSMWQQLVERQEMLQCAEQALANDHVRAFYQPKVRLGTGEIVGFEALLRICVPGQPVAGPDTIAAAFEESSLAAGLADRMAENVLRDIARWREDGFDFGHVAINASASELKRSDFAERLLERIDAESIEASAIQIEVTESVLFGRGSEHVERTFRQLADRGIKLALDDFGTGFASLSHLKRFPVEIIKIDRSFVRDLQIDPGDGAIVDALIGLAGAIQVDVVAEGIETPAQRDFLHALGCTYGQGYLFGPARTFDQTCTLLADANKQGSRAAA